MFKIKVNFVSLPRTHPVPILDFFANVPQPYSGPKIEGENVSQNISIEKTFSNI